MYKYVAFYESRRKEISVECKWEAQKIAAKLFNADDPSRVVVIPIIEKTQPAVPEIAHAG